MMKRVVLIGDSIRLGYEPTVRTLLAQVAEVFASPQNGGPSSLVLTRLAEDVAAHRPDVVHINAGLHDLKMVGEPKKHQVEPEQYRRNLETIVERLRNETRAAFIWALSTPIDASKSVKLRSESDVVLYNGIAREVMERLGVPVNDLHQFVMDAGRERMICPDGVHMTEEGYAMLGERVAGVIRERLA